MERKAASKLRDALDAGEVREVLEDAFYRQAPPPAPQPRPRAKGPAKKQPDHYQVICISMYREDLERLDETVAELKRQGHRKMSRSALIRFALSHAPLDRLPPSY
jgi:hypothetical protein